MVEESNKDKPISLKTSAAIGWHYLGQFLFHVSAPDSPIDISDSSNHSCNGRGAYSPNPLYPPRSAANSRFLEQDSFVSSRLFSRKQVWVRTNGEHQQHKSLSVYKMRDLAGPPCPLLWTQNRGILAVSNHTLFCMHLPNALSHPSASFLSSFACNGQFDIQWYPTGSPNRCSAATSACSVIAQAQAQSAERRILKTQGWKRPVPCSACSKPKVEETWLEFENKRT